MRRESSNDKAVAIAVGDVHAGNLHPRCRVNDDYLKVLLDKLSWITDLGERLGVPILQAGDLFDHWSQPSAVLNAVAAAMHVSGRAARDGTQWICAVGQHDIPNHNIGQLQDTAWYNMRLAKVIQGSDTGFCTTFAWGEDAKRMQMGSSIALAHVSTWWKPYAPNQAPMEAVRTLKRFTKHGFKLAITGDNHSSFSYIDKAGNILVNPGSVMRMAADQIDHTPAVDIIYCDSAGRYRLEHRAIPILDEIRATEVESVCVMDERIETFIKRLGESKDVTLSFKDNLKRIAGETNASADIISILKECTKEERT